MNSFSNDAIDFGKKADILKALAHPVRLCIVQGLLKSQGCNVSNIQNCIGIPQSTISQHLATLRHSGIIAGERRGPEIIYRVIHPNVEHIIRALLGNEA